jgi:hypothetical protein
MKRAWREAVARGRERLRENVFGYLVIHFFERFFAGEFASAESDLRLGIGGILALIALPGAFLPLLLLYKYSSLLRWMEGQRHFDYNVASIPDKYMFLTFTMVVTGIVTVLKWDGLFPDRLDYANLAPLPTEVRRIFLAKFVALMLFVGLFILALNAASTILFPAVAMGDQGGNVGLLLRFVVAHAVACVAGSLFMFFFFFALVGLLLTVLPYRRFRQISTGVQFVSVIALVTLLFFTPEIEPLLTGTSRNARALLGWLPTVWFLGFYQQILGRADAVFHSLATRAVAVLTATVVASLGFYAASYGRYFRRIPEMMEVAATGPGTMKRFVAHCFDRFAHLDAFERACFHFATKTLARSQRHRLMLAAFVALGVAIAIQEMATNWSGAGLAAAPVPSAELLSAPLAIGFFLLFGMRFIFNVPAELRANWAFRILPEHRGDQARRAARELMLMFLAPVVIVTFVTYWTIYGARIGMAHAAFVLLASLTLADTLLVGYRKIPFTCSYSAGKQNVVVALLLYFLLFLFFSSSLAHLEYWALSSPSLIPFFALMGLPIAVWAGVRYYESELTNQGNLLIFEDEPEPVVPSMDLR